MSDDRRAEDRLHLTQVRAAQIQFAMALLANTRGDRAVCESHLRSGQQTLWSVEAELAARVGAGGQ